MNVLFLINFLLISILGLWFSHVYHPFLHTPHPNQILRILLRWTRPFHSPCLNLLRFASPPYLVVVLDRAWTLGV